MPSVILEQRIIQATLSLGDFAARVPDGSVRDDIRDAIATLIRLCLSEPPGQQMRQWCVSSLELLDALAADGHTPQDSRGSAYVSVLRLQAVLPVPPANASAVKAAKVAPRGPVRALNTNEKKILHFIKDHPGIRTKELVEHFEQSLSDRTIKRALKELSALGSVRRTEHDNAVLYEVLDP